MAVRLFVEMDKLPRAWKEQTDADKRFRETHEVMYKTNKNRKAVSFNCQAVRVRYYVIDAPPNEHVCEEKCQAADSEESASEKKKKFLEKGEGAMLKTGDTWAEDEKEEETAPCKPLPNREVENGSADQETKERFDTGKESLSAQALQQKTIAELKLLLKERKLQVKGNKVDLVARLVQHDANSSNGSSGAKANTADREFKTESPNQVKHTIGHKQENENVKQEDKTEEKKKKKKKRTAKRSDGHSGKKKEVSSADGPSDRHETTSNSRKRKAEKETENKTAKKRRTSSKKESTAEKKQQKEQEPEEHSSSSSTTQEKIEMKAEVKDQKGKDEERREKRKKKEEADKDAKQKKELDGGIEGGSSGSMKQEEEEEEHKNTKEDNCVKSNRARVDEETLSNMKVPELRDLCDRLKVKKAGKKQDLIARLLHAEAEANDKKEGVASEVTTTRTTTGKQAMDKSEKEEIKGKEQATEQSVKENSNGLSAKSKRAAKKTKKKGKDEGGCTESKCEEVAEEEMKQEGGGEGELLRKKKVAELRALCESMQIKATGTKEELITRLCDHKKKKNPKADAPHTEGEKERKRKREDSKHVGTTEDLHAAPDSKRIAKRRKVDKVEKDEKRKQNEAEAGDSKENTVKASKKVKQDNPRKTGQRRSEEEEEKKATVEEKEVLLVEGEEKEEAVEESKQTGESEHAVGREERSQNDEIHGKTVAELKQLLKQHNLKVGGSKGDLIQRLSDHLASTSVASPSQPTKTSPAAAGVKGNSGASPVRNEKATTVNNKNKSNNKNKRKTPESEQVPADGEIRRPSDADADADDVAVVPGNNSSRPAVRVAKRRKQGAVNNKKQKKEKKLKEEAVAAVVAVNERERKASGGGNKVVVGGGDAAAQQSKRPVLAPARRIGLARRGVPSLHQATLASGKQK